MKRNTLDLEKIDRLLAEAQYEIRNSLPIKNKIVSPPILTPIKTHPGPTQKKKKTPKDNQYKIIDYRRKPGEENTFAFCTHCFLHKSVEDFNYTDGYACIPCYDEYNKSYRRNFYKKECPSCHIRHKNTMANFHNKGRNDPEQICYICYWQLHGNDEQKENVKKYLIFRSECRSSKRNKHKSQVISNKPNTTSATVLEKTCRMCGKTYPLTHEYWGKDHTKSGFRHPCRECDRKATKDYYEHKKVADKIEANKNQLSLDFEEKLAQENIQTHEEIPGSGKESIKVCKVILEQEEARTCIKCRETKPLTKANWENLSQNICRSCLVESRNTIVIKVPVVK